MSCTPEKIPWSREPKLEMILAKIPQTKSELSWFRRRERYRTISPRKPLSSVMQVKQSRALPPETTSTPEKPVSLAMLSVDDPTGDRILDRHDLSLNRNVDVEYSLLDLEKNACKPELKSAIPNTLHGLDECTQVPPKPRRSVNVVAKPSKSESKPLAETGTNPFRNVSLTTPSNHLPVFGGGGFESLGKASKGVKINSALIENVNLSTSCKEGPDSWRLDQKPQSSLGASHCVEPTPNVHKPTVSKDSALGLLRSVQAPPITCEPAQMHGQHVKDTGQDAECREQKTQKEILRGSHSQDQPPCQKAEETQAGILGESGTSIEEMRCMSNDDLLQIKDGGINDDEREDVRLRLVTFYERHNPSKVDSVSQTLEKFRGREQVLMKKLRVKYLTVKDDILPPNGNGPKCFLDFEIDGLHVGTIEIVLFADMVPLAAENFRSLCTGEKGVGVNTAGKPLCYRNCSIHRIVPNFCIQGGDFIKNDGTGGVSTYPPNSEHGDMWGKFKDELFMGHTRKGLLSMANNGPNRNGSQFFITLRPTPHLNKKHVVFGEVTGGMDLIDRLGKVATDENQRPLQDVRIADCGEITVDGSAVRAGAVGETKPSAILPNFVPSASFPPLDVPCPIATFLSPRQDSTKVSHKSCAFKTGKVSVGISANPFAQARVQSIKSTLESVHVRDDVGFEADDSCERLSREVEGNEVISKTSGHFSEGAEFTCETQVSVGVIPDLKSDDNRKKSSDRRTKEVVSRSEMRGKNSGVQHNPFANLEFSSVHMRDPPPLLGSRDFAALERAKSDVPTFHVLHKENVEKSPELSLTALPVDDPTSKSVKSHCLNHNEESKIDAPVKPIVSKCKTVLSDPPGGFATTSYNPSTSKESTAVLEHLHEETNLVSNLCGVSTADAIRGPSTSSEMTPALGVNQSKDSLNHTDIAHTSVVREERPDLKDAFMVKKSDLCGNLSDRDLLIKFYEVYNPSKCKMVDRILLAYEDQRDLLYRRLILKYKLTEKEQMMFASHLKPSGADPLTKSPVDVVSNASPIVDSCPRMNQSVGTLLASPPDPGVRVPSLEHPIHSKHISEIDCRKRLVEIYQIYNPSKLKDVDKLLRKYKDKESELFENVSRKYHLSCSLDDKDRGSIPRPSDEVTSPTKSTITAIGKEVPKCITMSSSSANKPYAFKREGDRDRLVQFYEKYNPSKVEEVDKILEAYEGQSELLFQRLFEKYSVSLTQDCMSESEVSQLGDTDLDFVAATDPSVDVILRDDIRKSRLMQFYEKHNPSKVSQIDQILKAYEGDKDELENLITSKPPLKQYSSEGMSSTSKHETEVRRVEMHRRLTAFYNRYNPSKLDSVDKLLDSYKGREHLLFRKLVQSIDSIFPHARQVLSPSGQSRDDHKQENLLGKMAHDGDNVLEKTKNKSINHSPFKSSIVGTAPHARKQEKSATKQKKVGIESPNDITEFYVNDNSASQSLLNSSNNCEVKSPASDSLLSAKEDTDQTIAQQIAIADPLTNDGTRDTATQLIPNSKPEVERPQSAQPQVVQERSEEGFSNRTGNESRFLSHLRSPRTSCNLSRSIEASPSNPFGQQPKQASSLTSKNNGFLDCVPISRNNPFSQTSKLSLVSNVSDPCPTSAGPFCKFSSVKSSGRDFLDNFIPSADNPFAKPDTFKSPLGAKQSSFLKEMKPTLTNPFAPQSSAVLSSFPKTFSIDFGASSMQKPPMDKNLMFCSLRAVGNERDQKNSYPSHSGEFLKGKSSLASALHQSRKQSD